MTAELIPNPDQNYFADPALDFAAQAEKLARRRKLAESLVQSAMQSNGGAGMHGGVYMVGNQYGNLAQNIGGNVMSALADRDQADLSTRQRQAEESALGAIPSEGPERSAAQLKAFQQMPSLRDTLKAQMALDKAEQDRIERGEQAAADRVAKAEEAERKRIEDGEQKAADRVARQEYRQTPAVVIHQGNSGSRGGVAAGDGKPLTAAQEKAALELGSNRSNLQMLKDTFKDEYAGDLRSTIQRKFGEVAGGAAPEKTQEMTRWWANQAMFDELPQRHELFGATLTAGEKAAWASAAISPNMAPKQIRDRLAIRAKIYDDAEARMRGSVEAGGKSVKQFDAATGKKAAKPTVVRTGTLNGRKVEQLSDGTTRYAN